MQVSNVRLELHLITYRTRNKTMNAKVDPGTLTPVRHSILWILLIRHASKNHFTPDFFNIICTLIIIYAEFQ